MDADRSAFKIFAGFKNLLQGLLSRENIGFFIASFLLWYGQIKDVVYLTEGQWLIAFFVFLVGNTAAKYRLLDLKKVKGTEIAKAIMENEKENK